MGPQEGETVPSLASDRMQPEPPPSWDTSVVTAGLTGVERINAVHSFFVEGFEQEMCDIHGVEAEDRAKHCGRARTPVFMWKQACDTSASEKPSSSVEGRHWRLMQRRLEDITHAAGRGTAVGVDKALRQAAVALHEAGSFCGHDPATGYTVTGRWRGFMALGLMPQALAEAREMATWCAGRADCLERMAASERTKAYRMWAQKATQNGGGAAHAFTKMPLGWQDVLVPGGAHPSRIGMGCAGVSSDPQEVVAVELEKWSGTWRAADEPADPLPPWPVMERLLPALEHEIRQVSISFKWRTGLGLDQLHPRHLALVSDGCLFVLGYLFYLAEACGKWTDPMSFFSFFLLAKPTGGFRTIGLLSSLYRVWAKLRMPLVRAWSASVPRPYFAAGVGKSTEAAVGRLLLTAEATLEGEEAACIIADIDKCYENVRHVQLIAAARRHNFPLAILRLCLSMYRAARAIAWNDVFSSFVYSGQTVVPGCSIALWLVQLLMISPLDDMLERLPRQVKNLEVYVDDASLLIRGRVGEVAGIATRAGAALCRAFEEGASLPISTTKGRVAASSMKLAHQIANNLKTHGITAAKAMGILGVDSAVGRGGVHGQARKRMNATAKRGSRFERLKRMGGKIRNVLRAAVKPAVLYGAKVVGLPPAILHRLRRLLALGLPTRSKTASLTLQFILADKPGADPTYAALEAPIMYWAKRAFGEEEGRATEQQAWRQQIKRLGTYKRPWAAVAGPAGAMILALRRLGWAASGAFKWATDLGTKVDVRTDAPSSVLKLVRGTIGRMIWREWATAPSAAGDELKRDPDGYWTTELRRWTSGPRKDWTAMQSACLSSTVAGGQWPQERLYRAGYLDDPACQPCTAGPGTVIHRTWFCRCLKLEREQGVSSDLVAEAQATLAVEPNHAFWSRGLVPASWMPKIAPVGDEKQVWARNVTDGCVTGNVYTDGSLRQRQWWAESERAGWGIAMLEPIPTRRGQQDQEQEQQQHQDRLNHLPHDDTHSIGLASRSAEWAPARQDGPSPIGSGGLLRSSNTLNDLEAFGDMDAPSEEEIDERQVEDSTCVTAAWLIPHRLAPQIPVGHPLYRPPYQHPRAQRPRQSEYRLVDALYGTLPGTSRRFRERKCGQCARLYEEHCCLSKSTPTTSPL